MSDSQPGRPATWRIVTVLAIVLVLAALVVVALRRAGGGERGIAGAYDYATELYRDLRGYDEEM